MTKVMLPAKWIAALVIATSLVGCSKDSNSTPLPKTTGQSATANADPDDVPITEADVVIPATFSEAVTRIAKYRDQIHSAIEGGTPGKAHRPLDELDIVLKKLMPLVRDSGVPKSQWQELNAASKTLHDSFNKLHAAIDRNQSPDYGSVEEAINIAIGSLEKAAAEAPRTSE